MPEVIKQKTKDLEIAKKIVECFKLGKTPEEVSQIMNMDVERLKNVLINLVRFGVLPIRKTYEIPSLRKLIIQKVSELYLKLPAREVGERAGVTGRTIHNLLKEGVERGLFERKPYKSLSKKVKYYTKFSQKIAGPYNDLVNKLGHHPTSTEMIEAKNGIRLYERIRRSFGGLIPFRQQQNISLRSGMRTRKIRKEESLIVGTVEVDSKIRRRAKEKIIDLLLISPKPLCQRKIAMFGLFRVKTVRACLSQLVKEGVIKKSSGKRGLYYLTGEKEKFEKFVQRKETEQKVGKRSYKDLLNKIFDKPLKQNEEEKFWEWFKRTNLPERNKRIVEEYYTADSTFKSVGKKYGVTDERVRQIILSAIKKLQKSPQRESFLMEFSPEYAVKEHAKLLSKIIKQITMLISLLQGKNKLSVPIFGFLNKPLKEINWSVRTGNCFTSAGIKTLGELLEFTEVDLLKYRNFGKKSLAETIRVLKEYGLELGMRIANKPLSRIWQWSARTKYVLKSEGLYDKTLRELAAKTKEDLLKYKNFGKKNLAEVTYILKQYGLKLGMKV